MTNQTAVPVNRLWFSLVIVMLLAAGCYRIAVTSDYRTYFSEDNPQLQAFEYIRDNYTKNDNVLVVVHSEHGGIFQPNTLATLQKMTASAWTLPFVSRVDSLTNFQFSAADEYDTLVVDDLVPDDPLAYSSEHLQQIRSRALTEPLLVNRLIAESGKTTGINITVSLSPDNADAEVQQVTEAARKWLAGFEQENPELSFHLTGVVVMNSSFSEVSNADMAVLMPVMLLLILLLLRVLLKSWVAGALSLSLVLLSIVAAMGFGGWWGIKLTPPSVVAPIIIMTLAVADSVHILTVFFRQWRDGTSKQQAISNSLCLNRWPVILTSLTTSLGFLSMNFSDSPPFRDLGNMVAVGSLVAMLLSLWYLPVLMRWLPLRPHTSAQGQSSVSEMASRWILSNYRFCLILSTVAVVGLGAAVFKNEFNDEFVKYFRESVPFRADTEFTTEHLTGIYSMEYALNAGLSEDIYDPDYLSKVEAFSQWLRQQPEVIHIASLTDIFKRLNKNMHSDDPAYYRLPATFELAAQYLLFYELSLPKGLSLTNRVNIDKSETRLVVTLKTLSTNQFLDLEQRVDAWLAEHAPSLINIPASSPTLMFTHIGKRNIFSMLEGTAGAMLLISIILIVFLRSWSLGVLSLFPNILPALMAFGIWGLFSGQVGLAMSAVTGMTLGIIVDNTIHFLFKFKQRYQQSGQPGEAITYTFQQIGQAMVVTTVILVCGFLVLLASDFMANARMGLLTAITLVVAFLVDCLMLPPLVLLWSRSRFASLDTDLEKKDVIVPPKSATPQLNAWDTDIWIAEQPLTFCCIEFGCRMTVIRLADGALFIHSPIELTEALRAQVDALGPVRYLVSPNKLHHLFIAQWKQQYPDALTFASPGLKNKRSDVWWDFELDDRPHSGWQGEIGQVVIKGSVAMEEVVFCHHASQTLLVADLVENFDQTSHWTARCITRVVGMFGKPTVPPDWRLTFWRKEPLYESLGIMFAWDWQRVILAHGSLLPEQGRTTLLRAVMKIAPHLKEKENEYAESK